MAIALCNVVYKIITKLIVEAQNLTLVFDHGGARGFCDWETNFGWGGGGF